MSWGRARSTSFKPVRHPLPSPSPSVQLELAHSSFSLTAKLFNIVPLPDTKEHLEAFNDLALEWVVPSRVEGREEGFWRTEEKEGGEEKVEKALEGLEKLVLE